MIFCQNSKIDKKEKTGDWRRDKERGGRTLQDSGEGTLGPGSTSHGGNSDGGGTERSVVTARGLLSLSFVVCIKKIFKRLWSIRYGIKCAVLPILRAQRDGTDDILTSTVSCDHHHSVSLVFFITVNRNPMPAGRAGPGPAGVCVSLPLGCPLGQ